MGELYKYTFSVESSVYKFSNKTGELWKGAMASKIILVFCVIFALWVQIDAHSYNLANCPNVEPAPGFQMSKFLGVWYVIQKTSTASKCISYNYTRGEEPGEYVITQDSDVPVLGLTSLKHEYHYTGELSVPEPSTPGRMLVRFPLNLAGSASHVVFDTDYTNYAGVFTCQKLGFFHRKSATILSRYRDLDKSVIDKLRQSLSNFNVDPFSLSIVTQTNCPTGNNSLDININPNTFTAENFGNVVRKAGQKLGDGVEWVSKAGSKVYHKITGTEQKPEPTPTLSVPKPGENIIKDVNGRVENNEVEWFP